MTVTPETDRVVSTQPVVGFQAGDWLVRLVVPLYIATGAIFKLITSYPIDLPGFNLIKEPSPVVERTAWTVLGLVVALELALAVVIALHRGLSRWLAVGVLAVFASVLGLMVMQGKGSCGCFGAVKTDPRLMLAFTVGAIVLILILPFSQAHTPMKPRFGSERWKQIGLVAGVLAAMSVGVHVLKVPERLGLREQRVELRPWTWVGLRFDQLPLAGAIDASPMSYSESEQTWVLFLRTCEACHARFAEQYGAGVGGTKGARVVAVELAPNLGGAPEGDPGIDCVGCTIVPMKPGHFFTVRQTPVVFKVKDGVVTSVE